MRNQWCVKCVKMCVITHFTRVCKKRCVILPLKGEKNYTLPLLTHDRVGAGNLHTTQFATALHTNTLQGAYQYGIWSIYPRQGIFCLVEKKQVW